MTDTVIELDIHNNMTPEQTLEKSKREGFVQCMVIGRDEDGLVTAILSAMSDEEAHWMVAKVDVAILGV